LEDSLLTPFKDYILQRLAAVGYCARSIYEELQLRGYTGSYETVKRFVSPLRKEATIEATVRFETPPARKAQADLGQCWTTLAGKSIKVHLFVMTRGYRRRMFAVATREEKLPAFIRCHEDAFDYFGGVPHEIIYDYVPWHIIRNPTFWDFNRYYGFQARAHRPYRAQTNDHASYYTPFGTSVID